MVSPANNGASLWYFAYGANMSSTAVAKQRQIQASETRTKVTVPGYALAFDLLGVPYNEPAFASLRRADPTDTSIEGSVHGVAYLISASDLARIVATEGAGIAYDVANLSAITDAGVAFEVTTLVARKPAQKVRRPSHRYMGLLLAGAQERNLPRQYQERLAGQPLFVPGTSARYRIGRTLFNACWIRVQSALQKAIIWVRDDNGVAPAWFIFVFDVLLWVMWTYHDYIHAILFTRGDGL